MSRCVECHIKSSDKKPADEDAGLFAALKERQIIGLILVLIHETSGSSTLLPRRHAWIGDLVVRKGFRRFGVGQSLVEKAHQWFLDKGITEVDLNV